MAKQEITFDTTKISPYRGHAVGRAFYNAFKDFVRSPENEKMIEARAAEIAEQTTPVYDYSELLEEAKDRIEERIKLEGPLE